MNLSRDQLAEKAAALAQQGVYVGTSSWKYPGWRGMLYNTSRYEYRGKFAETRFKRNCLAEYAEVFKTVCVDAATLLDMVKKRVPAKFGCVASNRQRGKKQIYQFDAARVTKATPTFKASRLLEQKSRCLLRSQ